jgi:hypothetical protein
MPRIYFPNGVTGGTKLIGHEMNGVILVVLILCKMKESRKLLLLSNYFQEIAQAEFLLSEIGEQGLDHTSPPSGTHHLVLERCYFSSDNASTKAKPSSRFGLSQQDNLSNLERKDNTVEVICLAERGSPISGRRFLHVGGAISWMRKHVSIKTS